MRTIKQRLEELKSFLEEKIQEKDFKLPKRPENGMQGDELEMVHPVVGIGNLPHSNFSMYGLEQRYFEAPYIMLGIDECTVDYEDESIPILIQVCCYTAEQYDTAENDLKIPDNMGILDVLGLLENIQEWLICESKFPVDKPIRLGTYDKKEMTYPFAFGYLSFDSNTNEGKVNRGRFEYD